MALLELPQELLDEIASHLDAHALLALRETGKYVYHAVGGDANLRVALVKLEQYWASAAHVCAVQFNYIDQESYPSYKRYLGRAPCFTCLRISTPQNTHRPRHQYPGWNMPMLPWRGDYDGRGREDRLGLFRECIDCTIKRRVAALARLAPATEKARARVAAKIDPRKTKGELPLDWALWKHVYEPASRHEHRWALYSKLKPALKHMQRYLAWMEFIDDRQQNSITVMAKSGINKAKAIVDAAAAGGWAVPAMCLYNVEGIIASVRAAEAKSSPVILQLFPWAVEYADGLLVHAAAEAASKAKVPIAVHMDHCQSPEMVRRAADLGGFDGIMVNMSHYEKEENLAKTKELTEYCHARGIITEAEPGRINGGEDGVSDTADLEGILTTPEQADEFIATGIDWLAPAFGNVHGKYGPKGPQLEYDRLQSIRSSTKGRVELVLHGAGAEYFNEKLLQECIGHGIAKCNINDIVNAPFMEHLAEHAKEGRLTALIEDSTAVIQKHTEKCMDWMGSTGKADSVKLE
ncbi:hypothetical protein LTR17_002719 [Elasticomyces elasticus]|nr:hypothetical protein LTR17_002719 [Elasticomyces elasticus]